MLILVAIVTVVVTTGLFLLADRRLDDAASELSSYGDLVVLAASLERRAADLQILARDFISNRDEEAATAFGDRIDEALGLLDRIAHHPGATHVGALVEGLRTNIQAAAARFAEVGDTSRIMGLDERSGLRGKLRGSVNAMESELRKWPVSTVAETYVRMLTMRVLEKDFILYGDVGVMGAHRKAYREFEFGLMGSGLDSSTQQTLTRLASAYRADLTAYVENQVKLTGQIQTFDGVLSAMPGRFAQLFGAASAGMERARSERAEVRNATGRAGIMMGAVVLVLALMVSLILVRSITRPLRAIEGAMQRLAKGDRTRPVPGAHRRDEIGAMARAIEVFRRTAEEMESLKAADEIRERHHKEAFATRLAGLAAALEAEVQSTVTAVMQQAGGIVDLAEHMKSAAARTGEQSSAVAEAAREATAGVHSVASASEELATTSSEIRSRMTVVGGIIRSAADKGDDTRRIVTALNEAARDIGNAAGLISDIAGQTNMLALNATIEAARAGESGRGFSVVAEEVKILAARTAQATGRISSQIEAVRNAAAMVADHVIEVQDVVQRIDGIAEAVIGSVADQEGATESISRSATMAADGAVEVSRRITAVAEDAGETRKLADTIDRHAVQVSDQVGRLKDRLTGLLAGPCDVPAQ
ncbi:methyl-accepting chemotaxis protein [Skermanella aerolata]|uniref:methyl-accepting chemotaxis protein n=1 Tax=Skermanella aerolata TaxID=393310 RepID=UPI003D24E107